MEATAAKKGKPVSAKEMNGLLKGLTLSNTMDGCSLLKFKKSKESALLGTNITFCRSDVGKQNSGSS